MKIDSKIDQSKQQVKKPKTGGRQKGTKNHNYARFLDALDRCDIDLVYDIVCSIKKIEDPKDKAELLLKLMPYAYPKISDIPHQIPQVLDTTAITISNKTDEELLSEFENR